MHKKKKKKKDFKYWIGRIHLVLGLASGLIVLLLGTTGCIYVFSQEITEWQRSEAMYVPQVKEKRLANSVIWNKTLQAVGDTIALGDMHVYKDPEKAFEFHCYKANEDTSSIWYFDTIEYYYHIYVDPYTGNILGVYNEEKDFFNIIKMLHWSLLLKTEIGQVIVGWGTFIFVIMLISGIILWWPKNKAARKQRFAFKWKDSTKWRRKNYDLHNILGFYISFIAIIIAFTGMVWAFTWFQAIVYVAGSQSLTPPEVIHKQSVISNGDTDRALDIASAITWEKYPNADAISIGKAEDSINAIEAYVQPYKGKYYVYHQLQFDQYSGKLLHVRDHSEKNFGEKIITANYDIHVGAILGIPGKIIAFIVSFICAMLPVTGFLIWWGRNNKEKKKKPTMV
ncbi:PepSY-associated TM helix domain-containing protein [Flavobacterium rhizosphaerae]|uniref:PepSY-associated TM helix domain-containing protein n=1 Tax=Flavobacterium rhizosphaerae TaxID=3163298 RepID=A0ABW8YVP7_9FLAO